MNKPLNIIITWATGMVWEGILLTCLASPYIWKVLIINRSLYDLKHPKLTQIIHKNMFHLDEIGDQLIGYDACYYAIWTTSLRKTDEQYHRITHDLTIYIAQQLYIYNPDMTFCYISGKWTDRSGTSLSSWINIKGLTETDLLDVWFSETYMYRPWFIKPYPWAKHTQPIYTYLGRTGRFFKTFVPSAYTTLEDVATSMIAVSIYGYDKDALECVDIKKTATKIDQ